MKLGGLLNELKNKIDQSNEYNNHLEIKINKLENDNSQLNWEYNQSYLVPPGLTNHWNYKKLYEYRQTILDKIANNNNYINELKINLDKNINTCKLYEKCFFYLNKNYY